jgi:outer membrane biosynthesis protein TonB
MERPDEIEATPTPPEALATPAERAPQQPNSAYRALKEQTRIRGSVNSRGVSSVNAVGTPLGRYTKQITDAIGSRWLYYVKKRGDLFFVGTTHVSFTVTREGKITGLRVHSNTSNEAFANVCLQSVEQSNPPPIPAEVYDLLPSEGLSFDDLSFTIFANE